MSMTSAGQRGEVKGEGRKSRTLTLSPFPFPRKPSGGWTLIELVITMTVMAILTMAVIPIVRTSIKRQRETRLREALREIRGAIDEFHRDTVNMQCGPLVAGGTGPGPNNIWVDPRSRVRIADCTIFGVDNPERWPPTLETLVDGVDVLPRAAQLTPNINTQPGDNTGLVPKKKIYLREIPVDPMTGEKDWCLLSNYDDADGGCSMNPVNVFDVRSKSEQTALNGKEKYNEW
jgi:general secretion pathway protein G